MMKGALFLVKMLTGSAKENARCVTSSSSLQTKPRAAYLAVLDDCGLAGECQQGFSRFHWCGELHVGFHTPRVGITAVVFAVTYPSTGKLSAQRQTASQTVSLGTRKAVMMATAVDSDGHLRPPGSAERTTVRPCSTPPFSRHA